MESLTIPALMEYLADDSIAGKIIFGRKIRKEKETHPFLSYSDITDDTRELMKSKYLRFLTKIQNWELEEDSASDIVAGRYRAIQRKDIPQDHIWFGEPETGSYTKDFDRGFVRSVRFIEVRFENSNREVVRFMRYYTPSYLLQKGKGLALMWGQGSALSVVQKDLIVSSSKIDCVQFGDEILVFNESNFERMFDLRHAYQPEKEAFFRHLKSGSVNYQVAGLNDLESKCVSLSSLRSIHTVYLSGTYKNITFDDIVELKENWKGRAKFDITGVNTIDFHGDSAEFLRLFQLTHAESAIQKRKMHALRKRFV